jgi:hypothetical protein
MTRWRVKLAKSIGTFFSANGMVGPFNRSDIANRSGPWPTGCGMIIWNQADYA